MNSGSEKKLSMDELMALNRPEPSPQPTARESSSPITPIVIQCPLPEALTMLTQKTESIGWEVRGMREYLPNLRSHTDLTAVQNSMAEIQKSLTEMTTLLEQAGKKKEKHSCKWLDWLPDFDLIVVAKWIVLVLLIVAALLGMGYVPTGQDWRQLFSEDLQWSIRKALRGAADAQAEPACTCRPAELAKAWFISSYPLLGAIAARFRLVTDGTALAHMGIRIAVVSCHMAEIYINPHAGLSTEEWRFVLAHEFLHAALRHDLRLEGRDPLLWNIACDFVINDWLLEMHVGCMPDGALYDAQFHGLSAEAVYDQILFEARRYEKLRSGDLLYGEDIQKSAGELDDFYRRALQRGLQYHESSNRGFLPAGLIEEIHALSTPPIPWDVQLGTWFVRQFPATQPHRSYARMSRRQSSSPDIPRPAWIYPSEAQTEKTFGIVLDTSGSMSRALLAAALGTIASYSAARGVHAVRLVFCDAAVYDQGVVPPERLSEAVYVQGRGGTQLQPGVDFFVHAEDFPKDAPILVITDGQCEHLHFHGRTHAYLLPRGHRLPFTAKGKIFRLD